MSRQKTGIVSVRVAWLFAFCCAAALLGSVACLPEEETRETPGVGPYHGRADTGPACGDSQGLYFEIRDSATDRPVPGALIHATANLGGGVGNISFHAQDTSDQTGLGSLLLHACDDYDVQVTCAGYMTESLHISDCCQDVLVSIELTPEQEPGLSAASTPTPTPCDYDWAGTEHENNCPTVWNGAGDGCDCGCQFDDIDCQ